MSFRMTVDTTKMQQIAQQLPGKMEDFLQREGNQLIAVILPQFGTSPAGRTYRRGNITHVASQPGFPPNVDTGTLRGSIRLVQRGRLEFWIVDGVEYGIYLEMGTSRMAARPWMAPAFEQERRGFIQRAREAGLLR